MKLPDFESFEPFNDLREKMGAELWTMEESFDERLHISLYEKSVLDTDYLLLNMNQLARDADYRLRFKNANVVLLEDSIFHLAACSIVAKKEGEQKLSWKIDNQKVCIDCLHQMNYEGVNLHKTRRQIHNEKISTQFNLEQYWKKNPNFPLKSRKITIF
ncbi:hypothetical protein [Marinicellulosiphila megalodicopiae]|uniref:hypothetical protein n=1 Tax=Marinicellulosiphila megalodicopiae TaxID=2724896 RepID=UPI003BB18D8C